MQPQEGMSAFNGAGVMLNFKVKDADEEHKKLSESGLEIAIPLEDHPWGDRGFSIIDPIGNAVYIYSYREPTDEFKQYFKD
ncbi:MAG: glyoxalase [Candidatus Cloacimonadota bacterium]|nr:MAG: glyoxalase [Candidatus Cloacimonadota bacterium]